MGASDVNAQLHAKIVELSGHATAQRLISALNSQMVRFQFRTILIPGRPAQSHQEHSAIVEAVAAATPRRPSAPCTGTSPTSPRRWSVPPS